MLENPAPEKLHGQKKIKEYVAVHVLEKCFLFFKKCLIRI